MAQYCKICNSETKELLTEKVLKKYYVKYFQCSSCKFIETENPYWLEEAYSSAITDLDIGLISRNLFYLPEVKKIINKFFSINNKFVDYGGGYGMFVRLMRDSGYDFYRQDLYCQNLFAKHFDICDLPQGTNYEMLTAFEVFEHLENPIEEIEKMLSYSDSILFSTELHDDIPNPTPSTWWYYVPETGQHISLFSKRSLEVLAERFKMNYYNHINIHLFTKKTIDKKAFDNVFKNKSSLRKIIDSFKKPESILPSLLPRDFELIKNKLLK